MRNRHPKKEVETVLQKAEAAGGASLSRHLTGESCGVLVVNANEFRFGVLQEIQEIMQRPYNEESINVLGRLWKTRRKQLIGEELRARGPK